MDDLGQCVRQRFVSTMRSLRNTEAAAIVELAVSLPLLMVLVVGIYDFGGAFNLKQELNNAVREAARFGASQPTNDLQRTDVTPPSVEAIRYLVVSYLTAAKINDCDLKDATGSPGANLTWSYNPSGCPGGLTVTIQRGATVQEHVGPSNLAINMPSTRVSITYPYQWHFNSVIQLLVPGSNVGISSISTDATAVNMD